MSVKVERETGWIGLASRFTLRVNGEKVKKIQNNETIQLNIDAAEATLRATQFGIKTNEITVKDNDHVRLVSTQFSTISYVILIILIVGMNLVQNPLLVFIGFILSVGLFISVFMPGKHYRLEHAD